MRQPDRHGTIKSPSTDIEQFLFGKVDDDERKAVEFFAQYKIV